MSDWCVNSVLIVPQVELIKQAEAQSRYEEIKKFVAGTAAVSCTNLATTMQKPKLNILVWSICPHHKNVRMFHPSM